MANRTRTNRKSLLRATSHVISRRAKRTRKLHLEKLESRHLLAFDPLAWQSLQDGLQGDLLPWLEAVQKSGAFAQSMPLVNLSMGEIFPIKDIMSELLVQPAQAYMTTHRNAEFSDFVSWLPQIASIGATGVHVTLATASGGITNNIAKANLKLTIDKVSEVGEMSIASEIDDVVLSLDQHKHQGKPDLELRTTATIAFSIGVDLASNTFFIADAGDGAEIHVSTDLYRTGELPHDNTFFGFSLPDLKGHLGFFDVKADGLIRIAAGASSDWTGIDGVFELRSGSDSLGAAILDPTIVSSASLGGIAFFNGRFEAPTRAASEYFFPLRINLKFNDQGVIEEFPDDRELSIFTSFNRVSPISFSTGLDQVTTLIARAANEAIPDTNPMLREIPLLGGSFAEELGLTSFLKTALSERTSSNSDGQLPFVDDAGLRDILKGLPGATVSGPWYSPTDVRYVLHIDRTIDKTVRVNLHIDDKLDLPTERDVLFQFDVDLDLEFGVRASDGMFFIKDTATPEFRASLSVPNHDLFGTSTTTRLGFSDVTLSSGSIATNAAVAIHLTDSNVDDRSISPPNVRLIYRTDDVVSSPGLITSAEMLGETAEAGVTVKPVPYIDLVTFATPSTTMTLNVGVTGTVAGTGGFTESGTLVIPWPNVFDTTLNVIPDTTQLPRLSRFQSIDSADVSAVIQELPRVLEAIGGTNGLSVNLPLVGSSVATRLNLDDQLRSALAAAGDATIQKLQSRLQSALNQAGLGGTVNLVVNQDDVRLALGIHQSIAGQTIPFSINENLADSGNLAFQVSGNIPITAAADASLELAMRFDPDSTHPLSADEQFFLDPIGNHAELRLNTNIASLATAATLGFKKVTGSTNAQVTQVGGAPTVRASLRDPALTGTADQRITFGEFKTLPAGMFNTPIVAGSAVVTTTLSAVGTSPGPAVNVEWGSFASGQPTITHGDLSAHLAGATSYNSEPVLQGINAIVGLFDHWSTSPELNQKLHVLDKSLLELFPFTQDLKAAFQSIKNATLTSATDFQNAVLAADNGMPGLSFIANPNGDSNEHNPAAGRLRFRLVLDRSLSEVVGLDFKISTLRDVIPQLDADLHVHIEFDFGLSAKNGFFVVPRSGADHELSLALEKNVTLNDGAFGPLRIFDVDGEADISVAVDADLVNSGHPNGVIAASDLLGNLAGVVRTEASAEADLEFAMSATIGSGDGPGISSGFDAHWNFNRPNQITFGDQRSTDVRDGFHGVQFGLGDFVDKTLGSLLRNVDKYNPIPDEMLDFLTTSLPIVNVTPLDAIIGFSGMPKEIGLVFEIAGLIDDLQCLLPGGSCVTGTGGEGEEEGSSGPNDAQLRDFLEELKRDYDVSLPFLDDIEGSVKDLMLGTGSPTLIEWNPDPFELSGSIGSAFPVAQIGPVTILMHYGAKLGVIGDFGIGLSTFGLQTTGRLMDGYFLSDNVNGTNDANEIEAFAQVSIGISGSLVGIVGVYGDGGIRGSVEVDLADLSNPPDPTPLGRCDLEGDNKIHLPEMSFISSHFGAPSLFNLSGSVGLVIEIGVEFLSTFRVPLIEAEFPIIEFGDVCGSFDPMPADFVQIAGDVTLVSLPRLFETVPEPGDHDTRKLQINLTYGDDDQPNGVDFIVTTKYGISIDHRDLPFLSSSTQWIITGTEGPDRVIVDPSLTIALPIQYIRIETGEGTDYINLGEIEEEKRSTSKLVHTRIDAGPGDDTVRGTFAKDVIIGGYGSDNIYAEDGDNEIFGDTETTQYENIGSLSFFLSGHDRITAGSGNDVIAGGWGNDGISAGNGDNTVYGGPGRDQLATGTGNDTVYGGLFEDDTDYRSGSNSIIDAGGSNNRLFGAVGDDVILATSGINLIKGSAGNDRIEARGGDNTVYGGAGDDLITTVGGADWIYGDAGKDQISAGDGNDHVWGGTENDTINAGDGNNRVWGGSGDDKINSGAGFDEIHGDEQNDTIDSGESPDILWGGSGADTLKGGFGGDLLYGEGDADVIFGGDGDDLIDAGDGIGNTIDGGPDYDVVVQYPVNIQRLDNHVLVGSGQSSHVGVEYFRLTGTSAGDQFFIGEFVGKAEFSGGNGTDLINVSHDVDITLNDWSYSNSAGGSILLTSVESATLQGGILDNRFEVSHWSGSGIVSGAGGTNTLVSTRDTDFLLTDSSFSQFAGSSLYLQGIQAAELTGGISTNLLDAAGFSGRLRLVGGEGDDTIRGGSGEDFIEGGFGTDYLYGGSGDDRILAGPGVGGYIDGGNGDDDLQGADDGWDTILGGAGDDLILGNGGNDILGGGLGNDRIHGGDGDDKVSGDEDEDVLLGEAGNDVLYAFRSLPVGAPVDHSVNYLFGDFGTNKDEAGSGSDDLFGAQGNDFLYGEGNDDRIQGGGPGVHMFYGSGEGADPFALSIFTATPAPVPQTAPGVRVATATLPIGPNERGRWTQFASSAARGGLSGDAGLSLEPSIVTIGDDQFVAWADNRNGNFEIYVARQNGTEWRELSGSASNEGISHTVTDSRQPAISVDAAGRPVVVWLETIAGSQTVRSARYDASANLGEGVWESLGDVSAAGSVSAVQLVATTNGPVVAWMNQDSSGVTNVFVKRFNGTSWDELGSESATGRGVSLSPISVSGLTLSSDGSRVAVAWSQAASGRQNIFLKQFANGVWTGIGGSSSGTGISASSGAANSIHPTLAYSNGDLFAVWAEVTADSSEIRAVRYNGQLWASVNVGDKPLPEGTILKHYATEPRLAAGGSKLHLMWVEDRVAGLTGNSNSLYARVWNGNAFADELPIDSAGRGVSGIANPQHLSVSVDHGGHPFAVWSNTSSGNPEVYMRGNAFDVNQIYYVNDGSLVGDIFSTAIGSLANDGRTKGSPKPSVRSILDAYDLHFGDVILIDRGSTGDFAVPANDSGFQIQGMNQFVDTSVGRVTVTDSPNIVLRDFSAGGVSLIRADNASLYDLNLSATLTITGGSSQHIASNTITSTVAGDSTGATIGGGASGTTIEQNTIIASVTGYFGSSTGFVVGTGGASGLTFRDNEIHATTGIAVDASFSGAIRENDVAGTSILATIPSMALRINSPYAGRIEQNSFHNAVQGVVYNAPGILSGNRIYGNYIGVLSAIAGSNALGFVGDSSPNEIYGNSVGVQLDGNMQAQHVFDNSIGVQGNGFLVASDLDHANLIESNITGVQLPGSIQFNRIAKNHTGVIAASEQLISNNLIYRNAKGVQISGKYKVNLWNNTFFTEYGDNVRVESFSSEIDIRNNIMWTQDGFDLYVSDDSANGMFSDYNLLHASHNGKLVHWAGDYSDILDWQENVHQFDLHSVGTTAVNPTWSQPRFVGRHYDNYEILNVASQLRFSSPSVDAGDPLSDVLLAPGYEDNRLLNAGFEQGIEGWTIIPGGTTNGGSPGPFEGTRYFDPGPNPTTTLTQVIDLATPANGRTMAIYGGRVRGANEARRDRGEIRLEFLDASNQVLGSTVAKAQNVIERWELTGGRELIPVGTRYLRFTFTALRQTGTANDAYLDGAFVRVVSNSVAPDLGAYGNALTELPSQTTPKLSLRAPDLYRDWEKEKQLPILWESYGNDDHSPVRIDLYQDTADGPRLLTNISPGASDSGRFDWIPSSNGIDFGTYGLRIQIRLVDHPTAVDVSAEPFAVPENTTTFYVNDGSNTGNVFTTSAGSNRHTGKLPQFPKPLPTNVLRIYNVDAGASFMMDPGDYPLPTKLVISNVSEVNDDEGFSLTGASAAPATLHHANPYTVAPVMEIHDADLMTISNLELRNGQYGIWAHDGTTLLTLRNVAATGAALEGVRVDLGSTVQEFDHVRAASNGRYGTYIDGAVTVIHDSEFTNNGAGGLYLLNSGAGRIESNLVAFNFGTGIYANTIGSTLTIGNSDVSLGLGNVVSGNSGSGIYAWGSINIQGNTIYGHTTFGTTGITSQSSTATSNVVFGNYTGIVSLNDNGDIVGNRVYNNLKTGIHAKYNSAIRANVVYSNPTGIQLTDYYAGSVENNLVYAANDVAITLQGLLGSGIKTIKNNTIYQPNGDGIRIDGRTANARLRNNIVWTQSGSGLSIASDSQSGLTSDYNLIHTTGSGSVGTWQGVTRTTFDQWKSATQLDANSLSRDPLFVDADGSDNFVGYHDPIASGIDDDFHLQSIAGSKHGGSLAPHVIYLAGAFTLPQAAPGLLTADSSYSPALNIGDPADSLALEPLPNGGFIDQGSYGNTAQAALSPNEYLRVTAPNGGEIWIANQTFTARWRSQDFAGNVNVDLLDERPNQNTIQRIAENVPNNGAFAWAIPSSILPGTNYRIRVTRADSAAQDGSDSHFTISAPVNIYYVNDGVVTAGDWTSAVGNDSNTGLSPNFPKATIQDLLNDYALGPDSIIRVDSGDYTLSTNVLITAADAGVTIEGFFNTAQPAKRTLVNRANQSSGSYAVQLQNADNVTLSHLHITGGFAGIAALNGSDSDGVTIRDSKIFFNQSAGIFFETTNDSLTVSGNTIYGAPLGATSTNDQLDGVYIQGSNAIVTSNTISDGGDTGIDVLGSGTRVTQNQVSNTRFGIRATLSGTGTPIEVFENVVFNNHDFGIDASGALVKVRDNLIHSNFGISGNQGTATGVRAGAAEIRGNTIYDNNIGIESNGGVILNNRIFANYATGVVANSSTISGNTIFSNVTGIASTGISTIENNVIYDNSSHGVSLSVASTLVSVTNNTVYQVTGNAIRLTNNATNVRLKNNILQVENGYALNVAGDSQSGFQSDYNTLFAGATGHLAQWGSETLETLPELIHRASIERHSQVADPQLTDVNGADNILGFNRSAVGTQHSVDDAGTFGAWIYSNGASDAFDRDFYTKATGIGDDYVVWSLTGLAPGRTYRLDVSTPSTSNYRPFQVFDSGRLLANIQVSQFATVGKFTETFLYENNPKIVDVVFHPIGFFTPTGTTLEVRMTDKGNGASVQADVVRFQEVIGFGGADDDLHPRPNSPTRDSGDPLTYYLGERHPTGGRTDVGAFGNTQESQVSNAQTVDVLSPNGFEKFERGQSVSISLRSSGLTQFETIALMNVGGAINGRWLADRYRTGGTTSSTTSAVNTSGVTNPAPSGVYQTFVLAPSGVGNSIRYQLPVADGMYSIRLHFMDPSSTAANQRKFDIRLQGNTVQAGFDIFAAAGGNLRAVAPTYSVTVVDGGISLELLNTTSTGAVLSAIELFAANPNGTSNPTVNLESSADDGQSWSLLGSNIALDRFGLATFNWNIPASQPVSDTYRLRVSTVSGSSTNDITDQPFQVVTNGNSYYIHNQSSSYEYTTAPGNDSNNGKSPDKPMESLAALLATYDLDPGDVIYVDPGTYNLISNVVITSQDSGVRIQGPVTGTALFHRGVTSTTTNHAFELQNADNVTFDHVSITGAYYGIYAGTSSDSDGLTVTNSTIFNNYGSGVLLETSNDNVTIQDSTIYATRGGLSTDNHIFGNLSFAGNNPTVVNNTIYGANGNGNSSKGVGVSGTEARIEGNRIYENTNGVDATSSTSVLIKNNQIYNNTSSGVEGQRSTVVGNTIYGHTGTGQTGIRISSDGVAKDNVLYGNYYGLQGANASGNEIYSNTSSGVAMDGIGSLIGNHIHDNPTGVFIDYGEDGPFTIANNLITNSSTRAFYSIGGGSGVDFSNNTVYQPAGDGFELRTGKNSISLRNNIVVIAAGYAVKDSGDSQIGFASDYNDFHLTGSAKMARWQGQEIASFADWRFLLGLDLHSQQVDPQFVSPSTGDFRVLSTSPTIDAGNPNSYYLAEPLNNGGRSNLGHTGNTINAVASPVQSVQIVSPNGSEKRERGETSTISFRSAGLTNHHTIALINAGGKLADNWLANAYRSDASTSTASFATAVNTSLVSDPAPQAIYQTYSQAAGGAGQKLSYSLPVPDGTYSIRLHFVEPSVTGANQRKFDIQFQGSTVQSAFDIYAAAGGQFKAVSRTYTVSALGGTGILLDLVNVTSLAILSGIEVTRPNIAGIPSPTINLEYSSDNGTNWSAIGSNLAVDRFGRGTFDWNIPANNSLGNQYLIRGTSVQTPGAVDRSDQPFQIADSGQHFYVNDLSPANDSLTSALGNDQNDGKSPSRPMRTLAAVLDTYDLNAGDTIHVDSGIYASLRNIVIGSQDNGVRIEGPIGRDAIFERGYSFNYLAPNGNGGIVDKNAVFELRNADSVTISRLGITGAYKGILADSSSDSDDLLLLENNIFGNAFKGVELNTSNDHVTLSGNLLYGIPGGTSNDNQSVGVELDGSDSVVSANSIRTHSSVGLRALGAPRIQILDNDIFGNHTGIDVSGDYGSGIANQQVISRNRIHDNTSRGALVFGNAFVTANSVFGHSASGQIGLDISSGVDVVSNLVYSNYIGISSGGDLAISDNRVFNNSNIGIRSTGSAPVLRNQLYSNSIGVLLGGSQNIELANNLVYANTNTGIVVQSTGSTTNRQLLNNTVHQLVGNAIRLESASTNTILRNNLISVQVGTGISVNADSQTGFDSNSNLFQTTAGSSVGNWAGVLRTTLSNWRAANNQDSRSVAGDPFWVDIDGADNILGYALVGGIFRDGGQDDNLYLGKQSVGIDAGEPSIRAALDKEGQARRDDPAQVNTGVTSYVATPLTEILFAATGTAKGWRADSTSFSYTLPFSFPFYESTYTSLFVSTEGFLQFVNSTNAGSSSNSTTELSKSRRVAPLWDDLRTSGTGDDIFVDESVAGRVTIRWNATVIDKDVQFAAVLFNDGRIRFDYGPGTSTALSPTVGVSMGNTRAYLTVPAYDGATNLVNRPSVEFAPDGGIFDRGALEFRGTSADSIAPTVVASLPAIVHQTGSTGQRIASLQLTYSEEVNPIDARATAAYELRASGASGSFDDSDDVVYTLSPNYSIGQNAVTLDIDVVGSALPAGFYRLTAFGRPNTAVHDLSGLRLDGNNDQVEGGDYIRTFTILQPPTAPFDLIISPDTGTSSTDGITKTGSVTVSGRLGESGLQVTLFDLTTGNDLGTATVVGESFNKSVSLSEGHHRLRVTASNLAFASDRNIEVTVDQIRPITSVFGRVTADSSPSLAGLIDDADAEVVITIDGQHYPAIVAANGTWSIAEGVVCLSDGLYDVRVLATDIAGNEGHDTTAGELLIDRRSPISRVNSLPSTATNLAVNIVVTGSDPASKVGILSSGVMTYDLLVSIDHGPFLFWRQIPADAASTVFPAESNHWYAFRSVARDVAGNVENEPAAVDALTYVPDLDPPNTQVTSVDSSQPTFQVTITGREMAGGTLTSLELYVSVDGAAPQRAAQLSAGTPDSSGNYRTLVPYSAIADGAPHTYRFYSRGIDNRANVEYPPSDPQYDMTVAASFQPPAQVTIDGFDIQRGATQRSFVRYVDIVFSQPDELDNILASINDADPSNDRMRLDRLDLDGLGPLANISLAGKVSRDGKKLGIDFGKDGLGGKLPTPLSAAAINTYASQTDGYLQLQFDLNGNGLDATDPVRNFYRLLGDVNGDRSVTIADVSAVNSAYGQSGANLNPDVTGDGAVNITDRSVTQARVGKKGLLPLLRLDD